MVYFIFIKKQVWLGENKETKEKIAIIYLNLYTHIFFLLIIFIYFLFFTTIIKYYFSCFFNLIFYF